MENNRPNIELIKKEIKKVRRAGIHTAIFGWLLLLIAGSSIWLLNNKALVIGVASILILYGLFYIFSGQYIKVGRGDKTQSKLKTNAWLTIPLCLAIFPIYICVISFKNSSRFKKFPPQIQDLYNKPKKLGFRWWQYVLLVLVLLLCAGSVLLKVRDINQEAAIAAAATKEQPPVVSTASKSHFTIAFPSVFSATDLTKTVSGKVVPYTSYVSPLKTVEIYTVNAANYPKLHFKFDKMSEKELAAAIHITLVSSVKDLHGKLAKSQPTTYNNYAAEDGQFTSQTLSGTMTGYIRVFFVGNYEYVIFTVGADKLDFDSFANSFQYQAYQ